MKNRLLSSKVLKLIHIFSLFYLFILVTSLILYIFIGYSSSPSSSSNIFNCVMSESSPAAGVYCQNDIVGNFLEYWSMAFLLFTWISVFGLFEIKTIILAVLIWLPISYLFWWRLKGRHLVSRIPIIDISK